MSLLGSTNDFTLSCMVPILLSTAMCIINPKNHCQSWQLILLTVSKAPSCHCPWAVISSHSTSKRGLRFPLLHSTWELDARTAVDQLSTVLCTSRSVACYLLFSFSNWRNFSHYDCRTMEWGRKLELPLFRPKAVTVNSRWIIRTGNNCQTKCNPWNPSVIMVRRTRNRRYCDCESGLFQHGTNLVFSFQIGELVQFRASWSLKSPERYLIANN